MNVPGTDARWRAWAGVVAPIVFVASWIIAGLLRRDYDPTSQAISRLAEIGAPRRWIVTAGMVVFGVGTWAFSRRLRPRAALALAAASIASVGVALFPCSPGCPGAETVTDTGHALFAGILYVALTATPVLQSRSPYAVLTSLLAATALALHIGGVGPNGLFQRLGLTGDDVWLVVTAARMLR